MNVLLDDWNIKLHLLNVALFAYISTLKNIFDENYFAVLI